MRCFRLCGALWIVLNAALAFGTLAGAPGLPEASRQQASGRIGGSATAELGIRAGLYVRPEAADPSAGVTELVRRSQADHDRRTAAVRAARSKKAAATHAPKPIRAHGMSNVVAGCEGGQKYLHRQHASPSITGKHGFHNDTWDELDGRPPKGPAGFRGYPRAMDAPESTQDEGFEILWDEGRGAGHWRWSRSCWESRM